MELRQPYVVTDQDTYFMTLFIDDAETLRTYVVQHGRGRYINEIEVIVRAAAVTTREESK